MIRSMYSSRLQYPLGLKFTSRQPRTIGVYLNRRELMVGRDFNYNEPVIKYVLFETYGSLEIKHVFLRFESKEKHSLYPLYSRVLSNDTSKYLSAPVVLYRQSIEAFLREANHSSESLFSLNDVLLDQVYQSIDSCNRWVATKIVEDFREDDYNNKLLNNGASLLPATLHSVIDDADVQYPVSDHIEKNMAIENSIDRTRKWMDWVISYLYDYSFIDSDDYNYTSSHPLWGQLETIFNPYLGEDYKAIKYDPITKMNMREVVVDPKKIIESSYKGNSSSFKFPMGTKCTNDVEYPTIFSSNLLLWLAALHHLPFREIAFTYILPTKNTPYSFTNVQGSTLQQILLKRVWMELVDLSLFWKSSITKVDVMMTASDEVWMTLYEKDTKKTVFVDMVVPVLLSQKLYS